MSRKKDTAMAISGALVFAFLGSLGYYLFTFDYKIRAPADAMSTPALLPALSIHESTDPAAPGPEAEFTLTNAGSTKISVLDSVAQMPLYPLYDLRLQVRPAGGIVTMKVPPKTSPPLAAPADSAAFDKKRDKCVLLLTSEKFTKRIPLAALFDFKQEGRYTLTMGYQPAARVGEAELIEKDVYAQMIVLNTTFDWPPLKAAEKPAVPALPAENAPAATPAPVPSPPATTPALPLVPPEEKKAGKANP